MAPWRQVSVLRKVRRTPLALAAGALALVVLFDAAEAPATVQEQRARLPPPAECADPVVGIWRAHQHEAHRSLWYIFTLHIERQAPDSDELVGTIHNHYWYGGKALEQPPGCERTRYRNIVKMAAKGRVKERQIEFGGTSWHVEKNICGRPTSRYYLDVFTGQIDPERQEFQSVNNDGGPSVDVPTVFRRIRCLDETEPDEPVVDVKPPPLMPVERGGGCNCHAPGRR
jgi:hypothetical protein